MILMTRPQRNLKVLCHPPEFTCIFYHVRGLLNRTSFALHIPHALSFRPYHFHSFLGCHLRVLSCRLCDEIDMSGHDYIGYVEIHLSELVTARGQKLEKPIIHPSKQVRYSCAPHLCACMPVGLFHSHVCPTTRVWIRAEPPLLVLVLPLCFFSPFCVHF